VFPENSGAVNFGSLTWRSVPFIRLTEGTIVHGLQLAFYFSVRVGYNFLLSSRFVVYYLVTWAALLGWSGPHPSSMGQILMGLGTTVRTCEPTGFLEGLVVADLPCWSSSPCGWRRLARAAVEMRPRLSSALLFSPEGPRPWRAVDGPTGSRSHQTRVRRSTSYANSLLFSVSEI
jgi:hypothetical protein